MTEEQTPWYRSDRQCGKLTAGDLFAPKFVPPPCGFVGGRERITPELDDAYVAPYPSPAGVVHRRPP
jgi:hypothetical protein